MVGKGSNSDNNPEIIAEVTVTTKSKETVETTSAASTAESAGHLAAGSAKSSLRDYRKPTKPKQVATATPQSKFNFSAKIS